MGYNEFIHVKSFCAIICAGSVTATLTTTPTESVSPSFSTTYIIVIAAVAVVLTLIVVFAAICIARAVSKRKSGKNSSGSMINDIIQSCCAGILTCTTANKDVFDEASQVAGYSLNPL